MLDLHMRKLNSQNILLFIISLVLLVSCDQEQNAVTRNVYNDLLLESIYELKKDLSGTKDLVLYNSYPDSLRFKIIKEIINLHGEDSEKLTTLTKLQKIVMDSLQLNLTNNSYKGFTLFSNEKEIERIATDTNENYLGSISLSKPVINDLQTSGCFYLAFNCRTTPNCSGGYIVFFKKERGKWSFDDAVKIWN